jgi:hypothetical protein
VLRALRLTLPTMTPAEEAVHMQPFQRVCDTVLRRLHKRARGVVDTAVLHEEVMQAKIILYNAWLDEFRRHTETSYPETAAALHEFRQAFGHLFEVRVGCMMPVFVCVLTSCLSL